MKGCRLHDGFTLIELLAVVVIISVLSAMTIGLGSLVYRKLQNKRAYKDLTNIQLAIEAFYKEYGHYPPCQKFGNQPLDWDINSTTDPSDGNPVYIPPDQKKVGVAGVGLEAYIFSKTGKKSLVGGDAASFYPFPDKAEKWANYLVDIPIADYSMGTQTQNVSGVGDVTMDFFGFIIVDPWMDQSGGSSVDSRYRYRSPAPDYQTYELGCVGPDGVEGTDDDFWLMRFGGKHTYEQK